MRAYTYTLTRTSLRRVLALCLHGQREGPKGSDTHRHKRAETTTRGARRGVPHTEFAGASPGRLFFCAGPVGHAREFSGPVKFKVMNFGAVEFCRRNLPGPVRAGIF